MSYASVHSDSRNSVSSHEPRETSSNQTLAYTIMAVALTALTAVVAYYCLQNGFNLYDTAYTSFESFKAGVLIYMGVAFSFAACANAVYGGLKVTTSALDKGDVKYSRNEVVMQIAGSILAPIAVLPFAIACCAMGALGGR